jgi:predicted nuclease with TOPRIM domain
MRLPGVVALRVSVILASLFLTACGPTEIQKLKSENEDLRSQVDDLQTQVDQLNERLKNVRSATSDLREKVDTAKATSADLESEASRFDDDNWQDVVPRVRDGSSEVSSELTDVDSQLEEVENAAAED